MSNNDNHVPDPAQDDTVATDDVSAELDSLNAKLAKAEAELAQMRESVLREHAEIENQRRRLQRDLDQARRFANEKLLGELLPVYDALYSGLAVENSDLEKMRHGIELTLQSLDKVADNHGLKVINPIHEAFNPEHHQAIQAIDSNEHPPGTVVSVLQKGFVLNDRLLRPALVVVARDAD
ncbi:molecular chaperone GrpE [Luteibacter sp. Sphag1AF]|uniref:nucleotide exchange factor GrpE n=1 Tax=Luteibacter sp. Sphag1AF TaxID=2587031 RepID=UPI00161A077F|nr:nucleotide exchange factor GrpE [Luteibacter sp. Sphag1AF]MBB3228812.1 molecular chaperone GrpE [Luteibacter sp. Sphag1AF]